MTGAVRRGVHLRRASLGCLVVVVAGVLALGFFFPPKYVFRVFAYRDAGYEDVFRFPARTISAPATPEPLPVAIDPEVRAIVESVPGVDDLDTFLEATDTTALVIAHRGEIVLERYGLENDAESYQNTFSVSKSVGATLVGKAIEQGKLRLDAPITDYLPELVDRDPRFSAITVEHLIDMRSGIRFSSDVRFPILTSDNPLIYYHPDLESVVLERTEIQSAPGTFRYNNYNPPLLGVILKRATGHSPGGYLEREIWRPMGASADAGWTVDDRGLERMESGFHARARDLVRFGQLWLDDGRVGEREVIRESWVRESTDLPDDWNLEIYDGRTWAYHAGWWIVPRPGGREDFCAIGRFGQFVYVSPQYDAVFVRNGPDRGDWGDYDWTELFYTVAEGLAAR